MAVNYCDQPSVHGDDIWVGPGETFFISACTSVGAISGATGGLITGFSFAVADVPPIICEPAPNLRAKRMTDADTDVMVEWDLPVEILLIDNFVLQERIPPGDAYTESPAGLYAMQAA